MMGYKIQKIYVGSQQVRPKGGGGGYTPTSTTILYMPMNSSSQASDLSSNNWTTTNANVTFGEYQGVDCGYFNGSNAKITISEKFALPVEATFLCRCYCYNKSTYYDRKIFDFRGSSYFIPYYYCGGTTGSNQGYGLYTTADRYISGNRVGSWYLLYIKRNGSAISYGVMGTSTASSTTTMGSSASITATSTITIGNDYSASRYWYGGLSEMILDGKFWSEAEITDYYNNTKADYGL